MWKFGAGVGFCPQAGAFLWTRKENVAACPRRGCFLWKSGAGRGFLSTDRGVFVDAEGDLLNYFVIGKLNS